MKGFLYIVFAVISMSVSIGHTESFVSEDFNNGSLGRFVECTTKSPNYVRVENGRAVTYWNESGFDGGRVSKSAEACVSGDPYRSLKETWMGFKMNIDPSHGDHSESGVAQIFQFVDNSNIFTWTGMLKYEYGDLTFVHRSGKNTASQVDSVIYNNVPRGKDLSIIIHYVLSANNNGLIEIWLDGALKYRASGINFGFGNFNSDDEMHDDTYVDLKFGQYNYADNEYIDDEERIIYYDNMTWYNGGLEGYEKVNPNSFVHMKKRNAQAFAIDGERGGANRQNVYLWDSSETNKNQQWIEIYRGNDYYSYQKKDTAFCLDGKSGGINGQNVYLWNCNAGVQNQHWKKVSLGNNTFRLEKRNAPGFALDGGRNGQKGQNVYLWEVRVGNKNQQWVFDYL